MKDRATPEPTPWRRILLVDDDPDVAILISLALGRLVGATVDVCTASRDALERARSFRPDVILLDVMMPEMDGPAALKALRADRATAAIPVVFISAGADRQDGARYRDLGALGVIPKPFDPLGLPAALQAIRGGSAVARSYPSALDGVRAEYTAELAEKIEAMSSLAAALAAGGWNRPTAEALLHMAHRLAGSSGLYGMGHLSRAAGILAGMLKRALDAPWPPKRPPSDVSTLVKAAARCARPTSRDGPGTSSRRSSTRRGTGTATGSR